MPPASGGGIKRKTGEQKEKETLQSELYQK